MKSLILLLAVSQDNSKFFPAIISESVEVEYSDWYYLKLTSDTTEDSCKDKDDLSSQILENICTKLSVPSTSFLITSLDTLSAGIISTNLSLLTPLPGLHNNLSNLQLSSPEFDICQQKYSLALLLHDKSHLVFEDDSNLHEVSILIHDKSHHMYGKVLFELTIMSATYTFLTA